MRIAIAGKNPDEYGLSSSVMTELPATPNAAAQIADALGLKELSRGSFQIVGTAPDELAALWQYVPFDALDFGELNQLAYQLSRFTDAQLGDFLSLLAERRQDEEKSLEDVLSIAKECSGPESPELGPAL